MMEHPMPFHDQLELLRKQSGLSYDQLAARCGSTPGYIWPLCQGKRKPSRDFIWRLSLALVLDLEQTDELLALAGHLPLQAGSTPKQTAPTHSARVDV
jgi:transcriptional regulator with XRE-family HTH domain